ncbi:hypothetical protein TNCV_1622271 [Trichonephila clavipes]|nr:hypothetical protein TNCV_1622271 [Trichonephila clavipes]
MDVCKCIVPLRHGDTLNSRQAASLLMRIGYVRCRIPLLCRMEYSSLTSQPANSARRSTAREITETDA